jgi:imidazole glycerol-phosphate synthase subunit HisH
VIALIDYGAGNLASVRKALAAIGADVEVPRQPSDLADARGVIVPGVGHFGATSALAGDWTDAILASVGEGRPLLGICLGMQWLFEGSDEAPDCPGLGLLAGRCYRLAGHGVKVPHIGWNTIVPRRESAIASGITPGTQFYFTHSFVAPISGDTVAVAEHGEPFAAVAERGQVAGVQFHPEKSGDAGLAILRNFAELAQ